jgi:serine protease Do
MVGGTKPGTASTLQVWRKGATRDLAITVAELEPDRTARAPAAGSSTPNGDKPSPNALGLVVADLSEERRQQLRLRGGVQVESADGVAARAGLRPGDIVLSLDNQDVSSARQFNELVARLDRTRTHVMLVRRGDSAQYVPIRPAAR